MVEGEREVVEPAIAPHGGSIYHTLANPPLPTYQFVEFPLDGDLSELDRVRAALAAEGLTVSYHDTVDVY